MDIHLFHFIHRIIVEPTRTTEHTKTVIDNILTKCPEKMIQSGVTEMGLYDHEFIYCTRKTSLFEIK